LNQVLISSKYSCTAAAAAAATVAEIFYLTVCFLNIEFRELKKADFEPSSHFVQVLLLN
jgi:hypothetical protein